MYVGVYTPTDIRLYDIYRLAIMIEVNILDVILSFQRVPLHPLDQSEELRGCEKISHYETLWTAE